MTREEAIEKVRQMSLPKETMEILEALAPELRESEEERIRKELIEFIEWSVDRHFMREDFHQAKRPSEWLAYLEKHKYDRMKLIYGARESFESALGKAWKDYNDSGARTVDGCEDDYVECAHAKGFREGYLFGLEKPKEHKPKIIIPKFRIGEYIKPKPYNEEHLIKDINENGYVLDVDFVVPFKDEDVWEVVEQKPAWSEEDEKDVAHIIRILDDCYAYGKHDLSKTDHENLVDKLKSLRPQPQRRDTYYDIIHNILEMLKDMDFMEITPEHRVSLLNDIRVKCKNADECAAILDEPSWKPSEEQMNFLCAAVDAAIRKHNESVSGYEPARVLKSLYEDLKKLM